jgi:CTP synthase (UTP-ammonia lyase)
MAINRVAVVGDYDPKNHTHQSTDAGLAHAHIEHDWILTSAVDPDRPADRLGGYAGVMIAPSSPYASMAGAIAAIRYARERGVPLVGT